MSDTVTGIPGHEGAANGPHGAEDPAVRFERDDIMAGPVVWFIVGLIVMTALIMVGVLGLMMHYHSNEKTEKKTAWGISDDQRNTELEGKGVPMSVGGQQGDTGRNRFRIVPGSEGPARNRSSIGNTPRLEGIDIYNPDDPVNHLPEHTVGRIYPGAAREQREREDKYLGYLGGDGWGPYANEGNPTHVPIEVAMKHLAKGSGPLPPDEWQTAPGRSSSGRVSRVPGPDAAARGHDLAAPEAAHGHEPAPKEHSEEAPKK